MKKFNKRFQQAFPLFIFNLVVSKHQVMAIAIKSIPMLTSKLVEVFVRQATSTAKRKGSVDFSKKVLTANKMLEKAKMKKTLLLFIFIIQLFHSSAQQNSLDIQPLKADLNANGQLDIISPMSDCLNLKIDNKSYSMSYELLGFELLSELSFKNNILIISGFNSGSGYYNWTYKFRYNKESNNIELIGYDDFNKWISGNISTSINTITNKFIVTLTEYNIETDKMETKEFSGKTAIRKIGLTDFKQEDFDKLSEIGMSYSLDVR
jgi:hypothetical protein